MARSWARRWAGGGVLLAGACLMLPQASASAAQKVMHSPPQFTVGPLTLSHGFKVTIFGGCNQKPGFADLTVTKRGHHYALSYDYVPRSASTTICNVTRKMGSGSLTLRWGSAVHASLSFTATGARKPVTVKGCTGEIGYARKLEGTGTLKMAIHTRVFGRLMLHSVPARIQVDGGHAHCPSGAYSTNFVNLTSEFPPGSNRQLDAYMAPSGRRSLYVDVEGRVGQLYQDVADVFTGSKSLFSFASNLSAAHIGSPGPLLSGSLRYSATSSCASDVTLGKFKGKLVVHDPVLGPLTFWGFNAEQPAMSRGNSCATS